MKKGLRTALFGMALAAGAAMLPIAPTPAAAQTTANAFSAIGTNIVASGMKYLGTPYLYGADPSQTRSFDCSSFTFRAFTENGINLPRTANDQYSLGKAVALEEALPGDLIFFRDSVHPNQAGHVAIYMGSGRMLHASSGRGVHTVEVSHPYWKNKIMGIKRVIPATHTVRSGDTLWKISLAHGVTVQELRIWNKLKHDSLQNGQQLMVADPDLLMTEIYAKGRSYVVQPGDTLISIAARLGVKADLIRSWNGMPNDAVYAGQRLKLEAPYRTYTVVSGDSLWSVSKKTRTPESAIKKANAWAAGSLQVGQNLKIPVLF